MLWVIKTLARIVIGTDAFSRILGIVERWSEEKISSAEKRDGVLNEIEVIGLKLSESAARLGVELAVTYLKKIAA